MNSKIAEAFLPSFLPSFLFLPLLFPIFKVKSVVPLTAGSRRRDHDETSLVLLFYDDDEAQGRR